MKDGTTSILVIEDEQHIRRFVRAALETAGYRVYEAASGMDGLKEAENRKPDLMILDLGLPDLDGTEVVKRVREWSSIPIVVLSARMEERDKVAALDLGADDYLTKPFGTEELLARLRVALRHQRGGSTGVEEGVFRVGDLTVDRVRRQVIIGEDEIHLTPIEYRLLNALVKNAGKVLTHQVLLREVWGPGHAERAHYLHIYMGHLRQKIETEPARPRYLLTEVGVGYRLATE